MGGGNETIDDKLDGQAGYMRSTDVQVADGPSWVEGESVLRPGEPPRREVLARFKSVYRCRVAYACLGVLLWPIVAVAAPENQAWPTYPEQPRYPAEGSSRLDGQWRPASGRARSPEAVSAAQLRPAYAEPAMRLESAPWHRLRDAPGPRQGVARAEVPAGPLGSLPRAADPGWGRTQNHDFGPADFSIGGAGIGLSGQSVPVPGTSAVAPPAGGQLGGYPPAEVSAYGGRRYDYRPDSVDLFAPIPEKPPSGIPKVGDGLIESPLGRVNR